MKKTFLFFIAFFAIAISSFAHKGYEAKFSQPSSNEYQISFTITDWNLEKVKYDGVIYQQIVFSSSAVTQEKGWAELPFVSATIQLPAQKNVDLSVTYTEFTDYQLDFPLVPSRGVIYRNQDPGTIPYQIAPASMVNQFYPAQLAVAEEPFIVRDVRGASVRVFPFQYNSATNTLRVYTKMDVLLTENNEPAVNPLLNENPNPIREARGMYKSLFMNYQEPRIPLWMADHGDILVITTARDEAAIQPYIDWKKQKGYNVTKEVVATGTNVKSLVQQKYHANSNLMYVLLVGDWADIQCDVYTGAPTDPMLGDVVGVATQYRPDISIGRMSANSPAHVTTQVNKTIQYEKNPSMEAAWYSAFAGLGSNDGSGGDDSEKDHTHVQRIYEQRLVPVYNYNQHYRFYDYENGGAGCTPALVSAAVNAGVSTIAYCGHGSTTAWSTTGFSNTNINALTNGVKLPFIVSVACVNGAFHSSGDCFAEAWLKKENGGAAITWMSTINQPWNPPMRGQDYFYDILIGGYNYTTNLGNGISTEELRTHWGSIAVNAANLMLNEVSNSDDIETVRTWCTFGDPNLQLRTKQPAVLASSIDMMIVGMPFATVITANGTPVKDALVCISQNGVYKPAFTDAAGHVSIPHDFTPGEVLLVVTAFNTTTIYENIMCIAPSGPYVVAQGYSVVGAENLTYISNNTEIEVTLKNVGVAATTGTTNVTIACDDPQITFNQASATCAAIAPDGTAKVKFKVTVANDIVDAKSFLTDVVITDDTKLSWLGKITLKAFAPDFKLTKVLIDDKENGSLPKGSLVRITTVVENKGGAGAYQAIGELNIDDPHISLACDDIKGGKVDIPAGETVNFDFYVVTSPNMPSGYEATIELLLNAQFGRSFTTPFKASNTGSNNYCVPGSTSCNSSDRFTSVKLYKVATPTDIFINHNPTCASGGYSDHTNIVVPLEPGTQYKLDVSVSTGGLQYVKGWFDFNGNNTFENNATEMLVNGSCTSGGSTSFIFTVPQDFMPGEARFRLRCKFNSTMADACEGYTYGQTLDYKIVLPELYPRVQNVEAVLGGASITVTWEDPEDGTPIGYNIYRNGEKLNPEMLTDLTFTESGLAQGIYAYSVKAVYTGDKESFAEMSNVVCFVLVCNPPVNFEGAAEGTTAVLKWQQPEEVKNELIGYKIFKGTEEITVAANVYEYQDKNLVSDIYKYQILAVYAECESDKTDEVEVTICEIPVILSVTAEGHTIIIKWSEPAGEIQGYYIFRDGEKLNTNLLDIAEYRDEDLAEATYIYQVAAVYEHCTSDKSAGEEIILGINDYNTGSFSIYPNPTTGVFKVETHCNASLQRVEIYDVFGRNVLTHTSHLTPHASMDVSHLQSGVYFVKIYSEESQIAIKKLIINH